MKRLRRTYRRKIMKRKKFRERAIVLGTTAAITLGTGAALNKTLAKEKPLTHQLLVSRDKDADFLADTEETAIGYLPFTTDQNRNETPDGIELARHCLAVIDKLPVYVPGPMMPVIQGIIL